MATRTTKPTIWLKPTKNKTNERANMVETKALLLDRPFIAGRPAGQIWMIRHVDADSYFCQPGGLKRNKNPLNDMTP